MERERTRIIRENVTPDAVVRNFLRNEKVAEPMQYIHFQAHAQRKWFPVWFYIDQTQSTADQVAEDLRKQVATYPSSRDALVDRLAGKDAAFRQSTGKAEALRAKLARGEIAAPADVDEDVVFAGAVQALPTTAKPKDLESIRKILLDCLDRAQGADPEAAIVAGQSTGPPAGSTNCSTRRSSERYADFRCGLAAGFFAATSFAGFLPWIGRVRLHKLGRVWRPLHRCVQRQSRDQRAGSESRRFRGSRYRFQGFDVRSCVPADDRPIGPVQRPRLNDYEGILIYMARAVFTTACCGSDPLYGRKTKPIRETFWRFRVRDPFLSSAS